jgi:hypothetical protein
VREYRRGRPINLDRWQCFEPEDLASRMQALEP